MPESMESSKFVSHCARMPGQFDSRKDGNPTKFERIPRIMVKKSFTEFCDSKLFGLRALNNMVISLLSQEVKAES